MKKMGIVQSYDGYYGVIESDNGEKYLLLKDQIVKQEDFNNLNVLDNVTFVPELYSNNEIEQKVARFVKKQR